MTITRIKETCLYVSDLEVTRKFYHERLGLPIIAAVAGRHVFFEVGDTVLLCFNGEVTKNEKTLPPHYAKGKQHIAFEVPASTYEQWKTKLQKSGVEITYEQKWRDGVYSFYFDDPDGHVVEIVPPGLW